MKFRGFWITVCLFGCFSGCYGIRDGIDESSLKLRNTMRAHGAWWRSRSAYDGIECRGDFGSGFRDGYYDVLSGGSGQAPTLPPRKYWDVRHHNEEGHLKTLAWFNGFAHGALAAEQEGAAEWNQIVTNQTSRSNGRPDGWVEEEVLGGGAMGGSVGQSGSGSVAPPPAPEAPLVPAPQGQ